MKPVRLLLATLLLAGCERAGDRPPPAPVAPGPKTSAESTAAPQLSPEQLAALAFRAAWGGAPPIEHGEGEGGPQTFRSGRLTPVQGDVYALVSEGHGGDSHAASGSLAVHYLRRTADGFERLGAWPALVSGGSWGNPPEWEVREDLTPGPAIVATGGGVWQGYACEWADVVELTPERPILRADNLHLGYSSEGALGDAGDRYQGVIRAGRKGQTFLVDYDRPDVTVTWARVGDAYDPVSPPDLPWC